MAKPGTSGLSRAAALVFVIACAAAPAFAEDPQVEKGVAQVRDGDLDAAVETLGDAAARLSLDPTRGREVARAHAYLGTALIALGHEQLARAQFAEVWKWDPGLQPSASEFPPHALKLMIEARASVPAVAVAPPVPEQAKARPALVYFYRQRQFGGSDMTVTLDDTKLADIGNGRYFSVSVPAGTHTVRGTSAQGKTRARARESTDADTGLQQAWDAGKTYYVCVGSDPALRPATESEARSAIATIKPIDRDKVYDPAVLVEAAPPRRF
jgi:hypothetical protein